MLSLSLLLLLLLPPGAVRTMFIQTESTPNPHSIKFLPGTVVLDERFTTGVDFLPNSAEVRQSPLAKKLFQIDGVTRVFYGKDFISVTKNEDEDWDVRGWHRGGLFPGAHWDVVLLVFAGLEGRYLCHDHGLLRLGRSCHER